MDSGWKQRYRDTLSSSADWVNGTRGDLTSGDPYRIARGTVGVVIFSSNFVPGAGEGITLARNAGRVGINELVDHSPQIEHAITDLAPKLKAEGENLVDRVASCARNSFSAATTILMADGALKAIADVRVGDRVRAIDPMTGKAVIGTVTATYRNQDQQFADITMLGADGKMRQLETTQYHRFWDVTRKAWVFALDLAPGDQLQAADGSLVTVESVTTYQGSEVMYDLTVDSVHDFFVTVAGTSLLVHNCGGSAELRQNLEHRGDVAVRDDQAHHIVPENHPFVQAARDKLDQLKIGINDAENGVFLPRILHGPLNKRSYLQAVNDALAGVGSRDAAIDALTGLAERIWSGEFI
jgi:hypothetical protein